ncbi:MAG TPA: ornithine decarboxylase, partial [Bacteroidia bacterium]|nr:ornithine decarboxylase [Bacteroidia bacterium]
MNSQHYNINQLRIDLWNELKEKSNHLTRVQHHESFDLHLAELNTLLQDLLSIEQYFSFPGASLVNRIIKSVEKRELKAVSNLIAEIVYQLVSDNYRAHPEVVAEKFGGSFSADTNKEKLLGQAKKNYFEVLYVEDMSSKEEVLLKNKFKELISPHENLTYDIVVQRSFQDALVCLFFNYNIQAACIRYAPLHNSTNITKHIKPFIQNVLKIDISNVSDSDIGPLLGKYIKQFRPELDIYYITDTSLTHLEDSTVKSFRRI